MAGPARTILRYAHAIRSFSTVAQTATQGEGGWTEELNNARPFEEMPGPKPLPLIGNVHRFLPLVGEYDMGHFPAVVKKLHETYGNIVRLTGLPKVPDMVFLFDPADIEKVFRYEGLWPSRPPLPSMEHYRKVERKEFFENLGGVLIDQGKEWHDARSLVNPAMMQPRIVSRYTAGVNDVSEDFIARIEDMRGDNNQMPADFKNEINKWALESIALITLDTRLGCLEKNLAPDSEPQRMIKAVIDIIECVQKLDMGPQYWKIFPTPTWRRFVAIFDFFTEVCMKHVTRAIQKIEKGENTDSVLGQLITRDPNPKRAVIMALDMLGAGIDTTALAFINVLLYLATNQDKQQKLFDELSPLMPEKNTPVTPDILRDLRYLRACIKESMRLRTPTIGNARRIQEEIVLSNFRIPKNVDILMPGNHISTMEKHFPQADKFIPERWLREEGQNPFPDFKANPHLSLPFGHGARKCVGMRFASLEIETLLAKIIRRYRVEWQHPPMKFKTVVLNVPDGPLHFTMTPRN